MSIVKKYIDVRIEHHFISIATQILKRNDQFTIWKKGTFWSISSISQQFFVLILLRLWDFWSTKILIHEYYCRNRRVNVNDSRLLTNKDWVILTVKHWGVWIGRKRNGRTKLLSIILNSLRGISFYSMNWSDDWFNQRS